MSFEFFFFFLYIGKIAIFVKDKKQKTGEIYILKILLQNNII